jgi:hypothetical protein
MSHATKILPVGELSERTLVKRFLEVCNCVIDENLDKVPFKRMLALRNIILGDQPITIGIYKDEVLKTYEHFTFCFEGGKFRLVEQGKSENTLEWRTCRTFLEHVVENPREYIEVPSQLKLNWIKTRLGLKLK